MTLTSVDQGMAGGCGYVLYQDAICAQAIPLEAAQETLDFVKTARLSNRPTI